MWSAVRSATAFLVLAALMVGVSACGGDDDEVVAAEWCRATTRVFADVETSYGVGVPWDLLDEWIETAPDEIRPSTEQAAGVLRRVLPHPPPPRFVEARKEIEAFADDHCPK
jgi:hypothetical protein